MASSCHLTISFVSRVADTRGVADLTGLFAVQCRPRVGAPSIRLTRAPLQQFRFPDHDPAPIELEISETLERVQNVVDALP